MAFTEFKHPLILDKLTRMRKSDTSTKDFRENLNEIAGLMVYEIARDIPVSKISINTPMGKTYGFTIDMPVVIVPILRAGLGMVSGIQQLIPTARIAHIGLYRDEETLKTHQYFAKTTKDITEAYTLIVDPMLATGGSAITAIDIVKKWGAKQIKFICLVAAPEGVKALQKAHPEIEIYAAALDEKLDEKGYIVPGLGDAGDRIFGTK
ncbi:uracil phosphoribosyltransferase [Williamsoniiplasma lucivorax]|uniref:Uracil phosphoribosyltransferase n=1 Tax=Williamsoniiplasma lucivorax TaxID=209274 RepID=A0A2S5REU6_9MOLU|nr:uracil phosphoribosyltransferase [Williamsoniiplasma lucivorax]PPE05843.1 uracil phosphoribosyltransferase [Williamsoniiplasma lucivorax]